ncbi:MAG TPA: PrsW family glutamic-type intramembrane protease [Thermomicrobiales bacterium]|nr:PrsW family glutamic-type intramembrane protease [Thermomicrobiales bacterium]
MKRRAEALPVTYDAPRSTLHAPRPSRPGAITGGVLGALGAGLGLAALGGGVAATARAPAGATGVAARFVVGAGLVPFGVLLLALGGGALWLAVAAGRGRPARPALLAPWWAALAVFVAALGAGWALLRAGQWWPFLPCAALVAFGPPAVVAGVAFPRRALRPSWRRILPAFTWGALVTPVLAIVLEGLAAVGAFVAIFVGIVLGDPTTLETLRRAVLQLEGRTLDDAQQQAFVQLLLREPLLLLGIGFVIVFAGPAVEEVGKFLGVVLFSRAWRRDDRRDTVLTTTLLGLAVGLGFATVENIGYLSEAGPGGWGALALLRAATPLMHGTASALFAFGWARQARAPHRWALLWGALGALALHGAWNLAAGLLSVASLAAGAAPRAAGLLVLALVAVLAALALGSLVVLLWLRRTLGREALAEGRAAVPPSPSPPAAPPPKTPKTPLGAGALGAGAPDDEPATEPEREPALRE